MKTTSMKGFTTIVLLAVLGGLAYYLYLSNRTREQKAESAGTEAQQLLNYDFEDNYPKTARETVKLHCRYMKCAYNREFTEEELITVNQNVRQLFDQELLNYNTEESQLAGLKTEIQLYEENKQKYISYSLPETSQIQTNEENGVEYAKLRITIVLKLGSANASGEEEYILRKDSQGRWKILGWQTVKRGTGKGESES